MFNGLNTQNTPNYQIRTFAAPAGGTSTVSLSDDCAPLQLLYLAQSTTATSYYMYLPTNPNPGKTITIQVMPYNITTTDAVSNTTAFVYVIEQGGTFVAQLGIGSSVSLVYVAQQAVNLSTTTDAVDSNWVIIGNSSTKGFNYSFGVTSGRMPAYGAVNTLVGGITNRMYGTVTYSNITGGSNNTVGSANATLSYNAVSGGYANNIATGTYNAIGGGRSNTISGSSESSVIAGGAGNSITGYRYGIIPGGASNSITGGDCAAIGNSNSTSSGFCFGQSNTVNGTWGVGIGYNHTVPHSDAAILGTEGGTSRTLGYVGWASAIPVLGASRGAFQAGNFILGIDTTSATPANLVCSWISGGQISLVNNSAYYFRIMVVATITGGDNTKQWFIEGLVKRGASAATTAFVGTPTVTSTFADAGAAAWTVAVVADTSNGGVNISVTGAAATNIRWVARVTTAEVTY